MTISIYNTLARKKEEFKPLNNKKVNMYVCGITPYDEVHLGHARAYVVFDVIRRHLEHSGYKVTYVQNFTDIDDKIINRAKELNIPPNEIAKKYIEDYFLQIDKLNVKRADLYPKVTENIPNIINFIQTLIKKDFAYVVNGDVYFSVKKFPNYGKLSNRKTEDLKIGARVEVDEQKNDPLDFALWKKTKKDTPQEVSWMSPWGEGRPGWHIECSVMSTKFLSDTIDMHGGGNDLIFPHHENEIAQAEAGTGKPFVKYWIHNGFVTINKEKMSKSLGNFFTLRQIFEKFSPRVVRYFLLSGHYRSPLDFSDDKLEESKSALEGIDEAYTKPSNISFSYKLPKHLDDLDSNILSNTFSKFKSSLDDDFNTERAISVIHELKKDILSNLNQKDPKDLFKAFLTFKLLLEDYLGIPISYTKDFPKEIVELKTERETARKEKDWAKADILRKKINELGYIIQDNPDGSSTIIKKTK